MLSALGNAHEKKKAAYKIVSIIYNYNFAKKICPKTY